MAKFIAGYGLTESLPNVFPTPIVALRAPTSADKNYQLGQVWINKSTQLPYILCAVASNAAVWVGGISGNGAFGTLTSTGNTTLATNAGTVSTFGNTSGATALSLYAGTGNFLIDGAASTTITVGPSLTTGTITIGGTSESGAITLGSSDAAQTVNIALGSTASKTVVIASGTAGNTVGINGGINTVANITNINNGAAAANSTVNILSGNASAGTQTLNLLTGTRAGAFNLGTGAAAANTITIGGTGANVITIGNTQTAGSIAMGDAMTTGTITIGGTGLQTGTVSIAPGTGAQTVNIATGGTGVKTVHIADGAVANVVTLGSTTGAASTTIKGGTVGIALSAAGQVSMAPATDSQASPSASSTVNARAFVVTFTGFTTASAASQAFTIVNNKHIAGSGVLLTVANGGANDAQMTLTRVDVNTAGTLVVHTTNNGAQALNGDVVITGWIIS